VRDIVMYSEIGTIVMTVAFNLLPRLFPTATRQAAYKVQDRLDEELSEKESGGSKVKLFFPWKAMIVISVVLTVVVNLVG
jgi:hypothetical protein